MDMNIEIMKEKPEKQEILKEVEQDNNINNIIVINIINGNINGNINMDENIWHKYSPWLHMNHAGFQKGSKVFSEHLRCLE